MTAAANPDREVEVAVVGAGPAGAAVATLLARAGRDVVVIDRSAAPAWRACGVFSSPASVAALRRIGLDARTLDALTRRTPAMRVETLLRTAFRLTYGDDGSLAAPAVGFARPALDAAVLDLAAAAGARIMLGTTVEAVELSDRAGANNRLELRRGTAPSRILARVVVGADGIRSSVARAAGVARATRLGRRVGLTWHVVDPRPGERRDARMVVLRGAYCGLAPVPHGRVNVGLVLHGRDWRSVLAREGAAATALRALQAIPRTTDDPTDWAAAERCDPIIGASPLGHRVTRRAGPGWILAGDAGGFLDPFTGEGLHRALVSAELGAAAVDAHLRADRSALAAYDRAMRNRFATKDAVSQLVQGFLARPTLFEYAARRLAARSQVRETMGLVMGDLVPARRALDPRFLAGLLAP